MGNAQARLQKAVVFLKTSWAILGITLIVLIVMETGFRAGFAIRDRMSADTRPDRRVLAEGYDGANWPIQHYRELELLEDRWSSYVYFRQKPFQGQTITIGADGLRNLEGHLPSFVRQAAAHQAHVARWFLALGFRRP